MERKSYRVKALVNGKEKEEIVYAVDPHDAVDVFQIYNHCWNIDNFKLLSVEVLA